MAIVTRSGKGNALTHTELDANFTHLAGDGTYQFPSTKGTTKQVLRMNSGATALEFATVDTDEVTEGSTNQYFTNARADARIAAANLQDLANTPTAPGASDNGKLLMWLNASSEFVLVSFDTTDLLPEGSTNLYYTDARAQAVSINELSEDTTPELSGDLVTAGNRITHASSGTVSMMDFTKTLFGETNHTVLSSVKSIDLFLDSNGGDTGQAFRIYNNVNPDGTVTENTHIFKVAETGDVTISGTLNTHTIPGGTGTLALTSDLYTDSDVDARITASPINLHNATADPTTNLVAGQMYFNSTTNKFRGYNGTSWVDLG